MSQDKHPSGHLPYDSRQIANWFIRRARKDGGRMTITKLLKLTYLAHGWSLGLLNRPLIDHHIEAWEFGPVIPVVYHAFRDQSSRNMETVNVYERDDLHLDGRAIRILEQVYQKYSGKTAKRLSNITHVPNGPWDQVITHDGMFGIIDNDLIEDHYKDKIRRARDKAANAK